MRRRSSEGRLDVKTNSRASQDKTKPEPRPQSAEGRLTGTSGQEGQSADTRTRYAAAREVQRAPMRGQLCTGGKGVGDAEAGRGRRAPQAPGDHSAAGQGCGAHP